MIGKHMSTEVADGFFHLSFQKGIHHLSPTYMLHDKKFRTCSAFSNCTVGFPLSSSERNLIPVPAAVANSSCVSPISFLFALMKEPRSFAENILVMNSWHYPDREK